MRGRRLQSGVTLIELLVAILLVSLLTLGILFAMRIGLNTMGRSNEKFIANRRVLGVDRVMHQQFAGFLPVHAECRALPDSPATTVPFFYGEQSMLRFASTYSLEEGARGYPRILEYLVVPGDAGGGVRLLVNEYPYSGPASAGASCFGAVSGEDGIIGRFRPVEVGPKAFVLADRLARCAFAYREMVPQEPFERWRSDWKSRYFPAGVRIDLEPLEGTGNNNLTMMPVTVTLHITRDPMEKYDH